MSGDFEDLQDGEVHLRLPEERDVAAITLACQDEDIQRYTTVPSPYTEADARSFVEGTRESLSAGKGTALVIEDARSGLLVGTVGLGIDPLDLAGAVGYWVVKEARGRGMATRATRLICEYAFEVAHLERLQLEASTENAASNAVAERLGFRLEGTRRAAASVAHDGSAGGERLDMNMWGLLPGELV